MTNPHKIAAALSEARKWTAVCTNRVRPRLQNNHSKGHQHWLREVHHLENPGQHYSLGKVTLCNRDSTDWLTIGDVTAGELGSDVCQRCASIAVRAILQEQTNDKMD